MPGLHQLAHPGGNPARTVEALAEEFPGGLNVDEQRVLVAKVRQVVGLKRRPAAQKCKSSALFLFAGGLQCQKSLQLRELLQDAAFADFGSFKPVEERAVFCDPKHG